MVIRMVVVLVVAVMVLVTVVVVRLVAFMVIVMDIFVHAVRLSWLRLLFSGTTFLWVLFFTTNT
jgi:hypothetical protein